MIVYEDPNGQHRIAELDAITIVKNVAAKRGYTYPNDKEALRDFIVIHWAWVELCQ